MQKIIRQIKLFLDYQQRFPNTWLKVMKSDCEFCTMRTNCTNNVLEKKGYNNYIILLHLIQN